MGFFFFFNFTLFCPKKKKITVRKKNSWNKSRLLNERLNQCDDNLLTDSGVKVTQIISAPMGTTVTENATLVMAPVNSNEIR